MCESIFSSSYFRHCGVTGTVISWGFNSGIFDLDLERRLLSLPADDLVCLFLLAALASPVEFKERFLLLEALLKLGY